MVHVTRKNTESRRRKASFTQQYNGFYTLARHWSQSLKMSLWRPHWMTLSPVSYLTSYSLSVINRYSADIWLQLISSPCKMETALAFKTGERRTRQHFSDNGTFPELFRVVFDWQASEEGRGRARPDRYNASTHARKEENPGYWIYKMVDMPHQYCRPLLALF